MPYTGESNSAGGKTSRPGRSTLRREQVELAALFFAVGAADLFANTLAHHPIGPLVLSGLGVLLIGCALPATRPTVKPVAQPVHGAAGYPA